MLPTFLSIDDVLESHVSQISNYGGSPGLRDLGLLESALAQPKSQYADAFLHGDMLEMAAAYLFHIVQNHPFIDGNKRVGLEAALLFLEINDINMVATDGELVEIVLLTAQSHITKSEIATFFRRRVVS